MNPTSLTQLLGDLKAGDKSAVDQLIPLVYGELRRLADGYIRRERMDHTLQPTALVHEAYMRLAGRGDQGEAPDFQSRAHFFGIAAQLMRQILVDHARSRAAGKRGGGAPKIPLDSVPESSHARPEAFLELEDALNKLEQQDARKARVIELKFFGGLTAEESADVLGVSAETVRRDLRLGQAWLQRELAS